MTAAGAAVRSIGVDIGGTFSDAVLLLHDGSTVVGKALTTKGDPTEGALAAIAKAGSALDRSLPEVLGQAQWLAHGTTVGLNAVLTGSGAVVGLLTTEGFEATLPIAKINSIQGLDELDQTEVLAWRKPELLVPRSHIRGVRERIDAHGDVLVPLDEKQARAALRQLGEAGVRALAVALLWATVNDSHEQRLAELAAEELPGVPVSVASRLSSRIGEYERTVTTVLDAYVAPLVIEYLDHFERALGEQGFAGRLLTVSTDGGVESAARARQFPIHTLNSGPIGGLCASRDLGSRAGHANIISTDVGGTSFDVGLVIDGSLQYTRQARVKRHVMSLPVVELSSIGTGGGSIAWIDPSTGSLRVGPQSAGSDPGPVCYRHGGDQPTVTDAACILGYIDRIGDMTDLGRADTLDALERRIAGPLGMDVHRAAEGILRIANSQMADLIRRITVLRGRDPAEFHLYAFGGAAPQYAGRYAGELGVDDVYIPLVASVFSAYGATTSDLVVRTELEARGLDLHADTARIDTALAELEAEARATLAESGGHRAVVELRAGMRFRRQVHEYAVVIDALPFDGKAATALEARFRQEYETVVGVGSATTDAPVELVSLTIEARLALSDGSVGHAGGPGVSAVGSRSAWFDGERRECPVYGALAAGSAIDGPAFVDLPTTTVVVYPELRLVAEPGYLRLSVR